MKEDQYTELLILDTESLSWSRPATWGLTLPPHRAHTATLVGKNIFVIGGGSNATYYDSVFMFNTETNTWSRPQIAGAGPGPRRAHSATAVGSKIYVFGGGNGSKALNDIFTLDTELMCWNSVKYSSTKKHSIPSARGYHTATLVNKNKLVVFGGSDGQDCFSDAHLLNTDTHEWTRLKVPNSFPRLAHSATAVGSMIFVFGGHDGLSYVNELSILDFTKDQPEWIHTPSTGKVPSARGYHTANSCDSRLFVFGGSDEALCFSDLNILDFGPYGYLASHKSEKKP